MDPYELPTSVPLGPWREHALCAVMVRAGEAKAEWWHPEKAKPGEPGKALGVTTAKAIAICNECSVQAECRDHAVTNGERYGIWGGVGLKKRHRPKGTVQSIVCKECRQAFEYAGTGRPFYCSPLCVSRVRERSRKPRKVVA